MSDERVWRLTSRNYQYERGAPSWFKTATVRRKPQQIALDVILTAQGKMIRDREEQTRDVFVLEQIMEATWLVTRRKTPEQAEEIIGLIKHALAEFGYAEHCRKEGIKPSTDEEAPW